MLPQRIEVCGVLVPDAGPGASFEVGVAYVSVRDVTLADVLAEVVGEAIIDLKGIHWSAQAPIPFEVSFVARRGASYALQAHVSLTGRREISLGDFLAMRSRPVSARHLEGSVVLLLSRVDA